jgi:methylenetetrahydrofolate dehydrogenase (NADP+)/methenyltetrahydrofolate cyclohydrolase
MPIIDNTLLKVKLEEVVIQEYEKLNRQLSLGIILANKELASKKYIELKEQFSRKIGIKVQTLNILELSEIYDQTTINRLVNQVDGVILQLPVDPNYNSIIDLITREKDVDLLNQKNTTNSFILPPTISAIDLIIKYHYNNYEIPINFLNFIDNSIDLSSKTVAVVGQGLLVGKPLNRYLENRNATIISINKFTQNPKELTKLADIIICAAGSTKLINNDWIGEETLVIDASTSEENNQLIGDIDYGKIDTNNIYLCKSPGGIGPLTVMFLFWNLIKLAKLR